MSWKNISSRRGEVSVRVFCTFGSSVRIYYRVYQLNISNLHRGVPPSCIQTSGQHITRCQVPLQPLISHNFSNVFCVQAKRFFCVFVCVCVLLLIVCVLLQPVWCCVHAHQEQNSPPACHWPSHRKRTLHPHSQEDPQVPPAVCESNTSSSVCLNEWVWILHCGGGRFSPICFPLVAKAENYLICSLSPWIHPCLILCICVVFRCVKCQSRLSWSRHWGSWALVHTVTLLSFTQTHPSSKRSTSL